MGPLVMVLRSEAHFGNDWDFLAENPRQRCVPRDSLVSRHQNPVKIRLGAGVSSPSSEHVTFDD